MQDEPGCCAPQSLAQLLTDRFDISRVYVIIMNREQPPTGQLGEVFLRALNDTDETLMYLLCNAANATNVISTVERLAFELKTMFQE